MTNNHLLVEEATFPSSRQRLTGIAAMIGAAACWGFSTVMSRDLLDDFTPVLLLFTQLCASVTVLLALSFPRMPWHYRRKGIGKAALAGILEPGMTYAVGLVGLSMTTAGSASLIGACEPVFIVFVAWMLLGHRPSPRVLMTIAIATCGLFMVSGDGAFDSGVDAAIGDLLVVLATLFAAIYVVISSRFAGDYPPATLAASQQMTGLLLASVLLVAVILAGWELPDLTKLDAGDLAYAAMSGVVQYALAFWLYLTGLRCFKPATAGLWLALIPFFGLFSAFLWLGEQPTMLMLLGGALIVSGVMLGRSE